MKIGRRKEQIRTSQNRGREGLGNPLMYLGGNHHNHNRCFDETYFDST